MHHKLTTGLARIIPIVIVTLGLTASPAFAGTIVKVGLSGKSFGNGQNLQVASTGKLDPSKAYTFSIEGTLTGTDDFAFVNGLTLAQLADLLSPNGSRNLTKVKANPSGRLPVRSLYDRVYEGSLESLSVSFTVFAKITGGGNLIFDINNIAITQQSFPLTGKIRFGAGSQLVVTVAPEIRFNVPSQNIKENIGTAKIKVARWGYVKAPAKVDYIFTNGTAIGGVDYVNTTGSVSFEPGQTQGVIEVPIIDNQVKKDSFRDFTIKLTNPSKGAAVGILGETSITLINDD